MEKTQVRPQAGLERTERPARLSIDGHRNKLTVEGQEKGFHYAWIRDDFVPRAERAWYEFVTHDVVVGDAQMRAIGGKVSIPGGNGVTLFLMRVPEDLYNKDMEDVQERVNETEAEMFQTLNSGQDSRYGKVEHKLGSKS